MVMAAAALGCGMTTWVKEVPEDEEPDGEEDPGSGEPRPPDPDDPPAPDPEDEPDDGGPETEPPDDGEESVFIQEPDGGGTGIECDVWNQDCPERKKCTLWANDGGNSWNATRCAPVVDPADKVGEPCSVMGNPMDGLDTCEDGSFCWDPDPDTMIGRCVAFCVGSPDSPTCADPDHICNVFKNGGSMCLERCNPLVQDCPVGCACYQTAAEEFQCMLDASGDEGAYGDPCEFVNVCDAGLFCAAPYNVPDCASAGCCDPFCDLTNPSCPDPQQECLPWYSEDYPAPLEELTDVGFCGIVQP